MSIGPKRYDNMQIASDYEYAIMTIRLDLEARISQLSPEAREQFEIKERDPNGLHAEICRYRAGCQEQIRLIKSYNNGSIPPLMFMGRILGSNITSR